MIYDSSTALPFAQVLPTACDGHGLRGLQDTSCTRHLCLQQEGWLLIPFLPHSFQGSTFPWVQLKVLEAVCSAAGGCVNSAGQRAENWLTHQHRKEQDCLYSLSETLISQTPPVDTAHRHPWLELIPLPLLSLGPVFPCSCYPWRVKLKTPQKVLAFLIQSLTC